MDAIVYRRFGLPDVLRPTEVPEPVPGRGGVKVRIRAVAVTARDVHLRSGRGRSRRTSGLTRPKHTVLGFDVAGQVVAVGGGVDGLRVGERVVGISPEGGGTAEFVCLPAAEVTRLPNTLTYADGAALVGEAATASAAVDAAGGVAPGRTVLVVGAAAGVGYWAVQLAAHDGAEVVAVCRPNDAGFVRSLGAAEVLDPAVDDPARRSAAYDLVLDTTAATSARAFRRALRPEGIHAAIHPMPVGRAVLHPDPSRPPQPPAERPPHDRRRTLIALEGRGVIRAEIGLELPLVRAADAHRAFELGHTRGTIVLTA